MSDKTEKEVLIERAVALGLGDEKTFSNISAENIEKMVSSVESRESKIADLSKNKPEKTTIKSTTVADLVKRKRVSVAAVPVDNSEKAEA